MGTVHLREEKVPSENCSIEDARRELRQRIAEAAEARAALASASGKLKALAREIYEGRSIAVDEAVARYADGDDIAQRQAPECGIPLLSHGNRPLTLLTKEKFDLFFP
jgi:hypothetical protein